MLPSLRFRTTPGQIAAKQKWRYGSRERPTSHAKTDSVAFNQRKGPVQVGRDLKRSREMVVANQFNSKPESGKTAATNSTLYFALQSGHRCRPHELHCECHPG